MPASDCSEISEEIVELRAELNRLSSELQRTPRSERSMILHRMWRLSGMIAAANERLRQDS